MLKAIISEFQDDWYRFKTLKRSRIFLGSAWTMVLLGLLLPYLFKYPIGALLSFFDGLCLMWVWLVGVVWGVGGHSVLFLIFLLPLQLLGLLVIGSNPP
jgi:hypothetical protein